jgi:hypothetical protein
MILALARHNVENNSTCSHNIKSAFDSVARKRTTQIQILVVEVKGEGNVFTE